MVRTSRRPIPWHPWLESLEPAERRRAERELKLAQFDFARPVFHQTFDDYRQVAPGCWLPFHESIDNFNLEAPKPFLASRSEQTVSDVAVNEPLAEELFHIELTDGANVATDWRYDPPIRYKYRKDQTEADRVALRDAAKKSQTQGAEELERLRAVIKSRMNSSPPALPKSGWLNGGPLAWEELRGKVVVVHFWDVNCGPCENELPFLASGWHKNSAETGIVVIGIHPPTENVAAKVQKVGGIWGGIPRFNFDAPPDENGRHRPHARLVRGLHVVAPHSRLNRRGLIVGHGLRVLVGRYPRADAAIKRREGVNVPGLEGFHSNAPLGNRLIHSVES